MLFSSQQQRASFLLLVHYVTAAAADDMAPLPLVKCASQHTATDDTRIPPWQEGQDAVTVQRVHPADSQGRTPTCAFCAHSDSSRTPLFDFALVPGVVHQLFDSRTTLPLTDAGLSIHAVFAAPCGLRPPNLNVELALETYNFSRCMNEDEQPLVCRCNPDVGRDCMLAAADAASPAINVTHELVGLTMPYGVYAEQKYAIKSTYTSHVCLEGSTCFTRVWYVCPGVSSDPAVKFELVVNELAQYLCPFPEHKDRRDLCLLFNTPAMCFYQPCKDDCSGHGRCLNGQCVCAPGYDGTYCNQEILCRDILVAQTNRSCASVATCHLSSADSVQYQDAANTPLPQLTASCVCPRGFAGDGYTCYPFAKRLTDPLGRQDADASMIMIMSACVLIGAVTISGLAYSPLFGRARTRGHVRPRQHAHADDDGGEGTTARAPVRDAPRASGQSRRGATSLMSMLVGATAASAAVTSAGAPDHVQTRMLRRDS